MPNPPKPTALKLVQGNPGKRALNKREPKPELGIPPCPKHLDPGARKEWRRLVKELSKINMLTKVDGGALAAYCQTWSRWVAAEEEIQKSGLTVKGCLGNDIISPWVRIANESIKQIKSLSLEFGLTPSSRSRISLPPVKKKTMKEMLA